MQVTQSYLDEFLRHCEEDGGLHVDFEAGTVETIGVGGLVGVGGDSSGGASGKVGVGGDSAGGAKGTCGGKGV